MQHVDTCSLQLCKVLLEKAVWKSPDEVNARETDRGYTRKHIRICTQKGALNIVDFVKGNRFWKTFCIMQCVMM